VTRVRVRVLALLAVAGCAAPANVAGIAFPRLDAQTGVPAALEEGTLQERGGCLVLEGVATWVLLWPRDYGVTRDGDHLTILDGTRPLVAVGSHVVVSGGELSETADALQLVDRIPGACQNAPYWQVTSIEEGSIEQDG
jgi:hypothetical protein